MFEVFLPGDVRIELPDMFVLSGVVLPYLPCITFFINSNCYFKFCFAG